MRTSLAILFCFLLFFASAQEWRTLNDVDLNQADIWTLDVIGDSLYIGGPIGTVNGELTIGSFIWDSSAAHIYTPGLFEIGSGAYAKGHLLFGDTLILHGRFDHVNQLPQTRGITQMKNGVWGTIGGSCTGGTDQVVSAIVWEGELYASHGYSGIGDLTDVYSFTKWNGVEWVELETVLGSTVSPIEMCLFNGQLWGGGDFEVTTNGETVHNVAFFDGMHWQDPNGGMSGRIQALYPDEEEGRLYVAGNGSLAQYGDVSCPNNICYWDGANWHPVGEFNDINYDITAIAKYRGQLYVGGYFELNGQAEKLAYFDGVHWQPVPDAGVIDEWVRCLQVYKNELYVAGSFPDIADLGTTSVARYYLHPDSVVWAVPDTTVNVLEKIPSGKAELKVYPNPSKGEITVHFGFMTDRQLAILDSNGKTLLQSSPGIRESENINLNNLSGGQYFCVLLTDGAEPTAVHSFIIEK